MSGYLGFSLFPLHLNHLGKVISITIMEKHTAVSPGSEKQSCLCFFPTPFLKMEHTLYCWRDKKVNCCSFQYDISVYLLQTGWLFSPILTKVLCHHYKWACLNLHLAVRLKWCKLGLKVKDMEKHFPPLLSSRKSFMFSFYFVHSKGTFLSAVFWHISLRMHVMLKGPQVLTE